MPNNQDKKYISYIRVSTERQGRSGLGLDAQRKAVDTFLDGKAVMAEYVEVESGRKTNRPKLLAAISHVKKTKSILVVAKLDRLSRNARFFLEVVESGVEVVFCDLPQIPPGAMGKFILSIMANVAELESGMISERTKAALQIAKERGKKLGVNGKRLAADQKRSALARAQELKPLLIRLGEEGYETCAQKARHLNEMKVPTANGGKWHDATVRRVENRLKSQ